MIEQQPKKTKASAPEPSPVRVTLPERVKVSLPGVGSLRSFDAIFDPATGYVTSVGLAAEVKFHIAAGCFLTPR